MDADTIVAWEVPKDIRLPFSPFWTEIKGRPKAAKFTYFSPFRPLSYGVAKLPTVLETRSTSSVGVAFTTDPLPVDTVESYELIPLWHAMGHFMYAVGKRQGLPIELTKSATFDPDDPKLSTAGALFKNPRGIWQFSYFTWGVGPTGHVEGTDPAEMLYKAHAEGFRHFAKGVVDAIVENL